MNNYYLNSVWLFCSVTIDLILVFEQKSTKPQVYLGPSFGIWRTRDLK